ncbi:MAG: class I SAM-dependent methyltransferase [Patescibacteria group bacterium]|jgi:hypothetical protein
MLCKICRSETKNFFTAKILNKYDVHYFNCDNCGFICTEEPYWLEEAYSSPINISDTGVMKRNIFFSAVTLNIIYYFFNSNNIFLDYAGGYGIFVRLMRDIGLDFRWQDNYSQNLLARGFEYCDNDRKTELVTAFEVFEHFVNPIEEIEKILKISENILFSTTLLPEKIPQPGDWWYYGFDHGQHLSFYSKKTFEFIAQKYGLNYYTDGRSIHLLTVKKINYFIFKILLSRKKSILAWVWAKIHFHSKTWSDHLLLDKK